ncbi:MAG: hypothetical protein A3K19_14870 [Lentisphaerae bacterium RIFOXYB12_FULL_65_16]|nr:MAG: hypothetical protein A3K18_27430 [Lentisphaerae bacterium RIFOXYA12_64_32]OGV85906.1 MAG: hypothetical protein A3K19_14870 [Lentisphaerae bacterium RIFOXYB12_FULL_65_16]
MLVAAAVALLAGPGYTAVLAQAPKKAQSRPTAPKAAPQSAGPKRPVYSGKDIPQGLLENLVAKVGAGGVTRAEYDVRLLGLANQNRKKPEGLTPEERKKALDAAVEDELLFQGALVDGVLRDEDMCWRITSEYRSSETTPRIAPNSFSDEELMAYYKASPAKFSTPVQVCARGLRLLTEQEKQAADGLRKQAVTNPEKVKGWIELGWVTEGQNSAGLPLYLTDGLVKMKKGQVSGVIVDEHMDAKFIFHVTDRKEREVIPYDEAKKKVRFEYISVRQNQMEENLVAQLRGGNASASKEELLLFAALKAGTHRQPLLHRAIAESYLYRRKLTREQALPELRKRFPVQILTAE